jgi:cyclopropane fatty-acyl-phospholipid synthase-like methyltransferase
MTLSRREQDVDRYYDLSTEGFYLNGWDSEHLHLGLFDPDLEPTYEAHPELALAGRYEAVRRMTQLVVDSARIKPSDVVVDAGCGVGGTALFVAPTCGSRVIGLNINRRQIDIARERAKARGLEGQVTFQLCDCSQGLPLADESVDVILNIESACHYSNRAGFIAECERVLRTDGRLAATDSMVEDNLSTEDLERYIRPLEAAWFLVDLETLSSYRRLLGQSGLRVTEAKLMDRGLRPNAYIMRAIYQEMLRQSVQASPNAIQRDDQERLRVFFEALLNGKVKIGRYVAEKG